MGEVTQHINWEFVAEEFLELVRDAKHNREQLDNLTAERDEFEAIGNRALEKVSELESQLTQTAMRAWNEGYVACHADYQRKVGPLLTPNPYQGEPNT